MESKSKQPLTGKQKRFLEEQRRKEEEEERQRLAEIEREKAEQEADDLTEFRTMPRVHLSIK